MKAALDTALAKRPRPTGILVMIDADKACPVERGQHLKALAKEARPDVPVFTVVTNCEFEAWFLASAPSLAGKFGLPEDLEGPNEPDEVRGAKEGLSNRMPPGTKYRETAHHKSSSSST